MYKPALSSLWTTVALTKFPLCRLMPAVVGLPLTSITRKRIPAFGPPTSIRQANDRYQLIKPLSLVILISIIWVRASFSSHLRPFSTLCLLPLTLFANHCVFSINTFTAEEIAIMAYTPRHSHFDNEKDLGPDDSISVVSTSTVSDSQPCTMNIRTPPSSSASTSTPNRSSNIPYITRNSAPGPGSTYIIVHKSGDVIKALTVIRGRLGLVTPLELLPNPPVLDAVQAKTFAGICNWHWHCEESDGWLGFRNAATGLWLRSSSICFDEDKMPEAVHLGGILSDATGSTLGNLGVNEQFCVRKAVDDKGYVLLKRVDHKKTVYLLPVKVVSVRAAMGPAAINPKTADMDKQRMTWEFVEVGHEFTPETRITCQPL